MDYIFFSFVHTPFPNVIIYPMINFSVKCLFSFFSITSTHQAMNKGKFISTLIETVNNI